MKDLQPTPKEIRFLSRFSKLNIAMSIGLFACVIFLFAVEYRPIVISYRTVALNTAYQPSLSRVTDVTVSAQISCTSLLVAGQAGSVNIQTSPDGITYTTYNQITNSTSGVLNITSVNGGILSAKVPVGGYYKITTTSTGAPTFSILTQATEEQQ